MLFYSEKTLTRLIFAALILGALVGAFAPGLAPWVSWMGRIFKLSLAMIVMPLVLTSIIDGMASIGDVRRLGRLGIKTVAYYLSTTVIAIVIGLTLVTSIAPGVRPPSPEVSAAVSQVSLQNKESSPELLAQAVTSAKKDLSKTAAEDLKTQLRALQDQGASSEEMRAATLRLVGSLELRARLSGGAPPAPVESPSAYQFFLKQLDKALVNPFSALAKGNVLAVIVFALLLGGALTTLGRRGREVLRVNRTVNQAITKIVELIMAFAPLGVFGLLVDVVAATGPDVFRDLGIYAGCVVLGLSIHAFVVLPLIVLFVAKVRPRRFFGAIRPAMAVAFSTSSSNATLPVTMESVEKNLEVDKRVSGFVLPLGATVNMDGTALYEAVAAVFIAQMYGVALDFKGQIIVAITAALAAVGAAGIPAAGTVTMAMVLAAVGLPLEGIGLLLAVDRPLDMCRTAVNVTGDATGALVINELAVGELPPEPLDEGLIDGEPEES
jgi:solute carrier family 1 (high affinity glutamate transporter) protein 1